MGLIEGLNEILLDHGVRGRIGGLKVVQHRNSQTVGKTVGQCVNSSTSHEGYYL